MRTVRILPSNPLALCSLLTGWHSKHLSCDQYCSNNVVSTIMDLKDALWEDVFTVLHLVGTCFGNLGLSGCICQVRAHVIVSQQLRVC